jgi:hypothetical protein
LSHCPRLNVPSGRGGQRGKRCAARKPARKVTVAHHLVHQFAPREAAIAAVQRGAAAHNALGRPVHAILCDAETRRALPNRGHPERPPGQIEPFRWLPTGLFRLLHEVITARAERLNIFSGLGAFFHAADAASNAYRPICLFKRSHRGPAFLQGGYLNLALTNLKKALSCAYESEMTKKCIDHLFVQPQQALARDSL